MMPQEESHCVLPGNQLTFPNTCLWVNQTNGYAAAL